MTNDLTTLSGALLEMKDELIYQLGQKGVTASYSSTDGLLGLIGRIADIQTGGGGSCYHIEFDESSYVAIGGTVTVSCTLQENYSLKSGATVTFTATGISQTATTDSNGVATTTISNISSNLTLTCTYSNVSDTATINAPTFLINDDASVDNSSTLFGNSIALRNSGSNSVAWVSDGTYRVTNTGSQKESMRVLSPLTGVTGDFCLEYDSYVEQSGGSSGFVIYNSSTSWAKLTDDASSDYTFWWGYNNGSFHETKFYGNIVTNKKWVHYKYTLQGTTFSMEVTYNDSTVASRSETIPFNRSSSTQYGLDSEWQSNTKTKYKNLVAYTI